MFANQRFGEVWWHSMHTIPHTHLTRCCKICHCNEHKLPALWVMRPEQNTALNARTEQFIKAKIPENALKQGICNAPDFDLQCWWKTKKTNINIVIVRWDWSPLAPLCAPLCRILCAFAGLHNKIHVCGFIAIHEPWRTVVVKTIKSRVVSDHMCYYVIAQKDSEDRRGAWSVDLLANDTWLWLEFLSWELPKI